MHRILISDPLDSSGLDILRASGAELLELPDDGAAAAARADRRLRRPGRAQHATKVTRELLAAGRRLKVVGRAGIGVDNVDVKAATELGILVVNAPTANMLSATEHTFALLLSLARHVPAADASMRAGQWDRKRFVGVELQGKTLGVVGLGRIGQRVAARARAFEMKVVAFDPFLDAAAARRLDVELLDLDELLGRADIVTLHTPLTDQTRGLLGAARLARMKPGALLINCGRGGVVDEAALLAALDSGRLAGAALDVFAEEPPTDWTPGPPPEGGVHPAHRRPDPGGAGADLDRDGADGAGGARRLAGGDRRQPAVRLDRPPRRAVPGARRAARSAGRGAAGGRPAAAGDRPVGGRGGAAPAGRRWRCSRGR